jgi:hypothetical protein
MVKFRVLYQALTKVGPLPGKVFLDWLQGANLIWQKQKFKHPLLLS